jgi:predicted nucleic acid-binding Zn ribbon protein
MLDADTKTESALQNFAVEFKSTKEHARNILLYAEDIRARIVKETGKGTDWRFEQIRVYLQQNVEVLVKAEKYLNLEIDARKQTPMRRCYECGELFPSESKMEPISCGNNCKALFLDPNVCTMPSGDSWKEAGERNKKYAEETTRMEAEILGRKPRRMVTVVKPGPSAKDIAENPEKFTYCLYCSNALVDDTEKYCSERCASLDSSSKDTTARPEPSTKGICWYCAEPVEEWDQKYCSETCASLDRQNSM